MPTLHSRAYAALLESDPALKCACAQALRADWQRAALCVDSTEVAPVAVPEPGRPPHPRLVSPRAVARRNVSAIPGRAALIHALAHIEFNAVNLALDAVYRFRGLPHGYYADWVRVAADEAYHFTLLREHLQTLGYDYGSFTAHNGLWEMAVKTAHDPLVRMALVPRVLEARGLDASPALIAKLDSCGDARAVEIMRIIQRDEVEHVRIGNHWYGHFCSERGLEPVETFRNLLKEFNAPRLRAPFDMTARRQAGFSERELSLLELLAHGNEEA